MRPPDPAERRYYDRISRLKAMEPLYLKSKRALEANEPTELKLIAYERIADLITRAASADHSMLLGQIKEAIERVNEPEQVVAYYERERDRLASVTPPVVVDDDQSKSN